MARAKWTKRDGLIAGLSGGTASGLATLLHEHFPAQDGWEFEAWTAGTIFVFVLILMPVLNFVADRIFPRATDETT